MLGAFPLCRSEMPVTSANAERSRADLILNHRSRKDGSRTNEDSEEVRKGHH